MLSLIEWKCGLWRFLYNDVHITYNYHSLSAFSNRVHGAKRIDIAAAVCTENERKKFEHACRYDSMNLKSSHNVF